PAPAAPSRRVVLARVPHAHGRARMGRSARDDVARGRHDRARLGPGTLLGGTADGAVDHSVREGQAEACPYSICSLITGTSAIAALAALAISVTSPCRGSSVGMLSSSRSA